MLCLSGFELYSRWLPLNSVIHRLTVAETNCVNRKLDISPLDKSLSSE